MSILTVKQKSRLPQSCFTVSIDIIAAYWSPDGSRIAVRYQGLVGKGNVIIWDAVSGRQLLRFTPGLIGPLAWSPDSKYIACITTESFLRFLVWVAQ